MPTTKTVGTPSPANQAIGGVPEIHYFDFCSRGRGQVIRLMCEDAGIAYKDVRYTFEEYPRLKREKLTALNPLGTLPLVLLNDKILTQSYAILRHFARQLGAYEGGTEEEKYWTDVVCDIVIDCMCRCLELDTLREVDDACPYPKGGQDLLMLI
ncbi:MAG: hypothetical protein Q9165_006801 [Trypethelium subeluteriae]